MINRRVSVAIETARFICPSLRLPLKSVEKESKRDRLRRPRQNNRLCLPTDANLAKPRLRGRDLRCVPLIDRMN